MDKCILMTPFEVYLGILFLVGRYQRDGKKNVVQPCTMLVLMRQIDTMSWFGISTFKANAEIIIHNRSELWEGEGSAKR